MEIVKMTKILLVKDREPGMLWGCKESDMTERLKNNKKCHLEVI